MKKKSVNFAFISTLFCIAISMLSMLGCSIPGTYINANDNIGNSDLRDRLLKPVIVAFEDPQNETELFKYFNSPYQYVVGPYDTLNIVVWGHPELSSPTMQNTRELYNNLYVTSSQPSLFPQFNAQETGIFVDADGNAMFPLVGKIKVTGLTVIQIREQLTKKLSEYLNYPQVTVRVVVFNSQRVHVIGEVVQPNVRFLTDRPLTILDAINLCGGINPLSANASYIYVIRNDNATRRIILYWLKAKSPRALLMAEQFRLAANDIVYVAPAAISSWNRLVSQILPSVQTIWYTRALGRD